MRKLLLLSLIAATAFVSCKKDEPQPEPLPTNPTTPPAGQTGTLKITFHHKVGDSSLVLHSGSYVNENLDTFTVNMLKYYISNIRLRKPDNTEYVQPESYFLINQANPGSTTITIPSVPAGTYSGISFMIGVDSTRNCSGAQTGALDPANGMFWTWNTGYIFFKMEGTSPQTSSGYIYHVGGYQGGNKAMRTVQPTFGTNQLNVQASNQPEIGINVNLLEVFKSPTTVNLANTNFIMNSGANAAMLANNYSDMFTVSYINN